jgi:hypothetical protein
VRNLRNLAIALASGLLVLSPYAAKMIRAQEAAGITPCGHNPGQLECHCSRMVARRQEAIIDKCAKESSTHEEYLACLLKAPGICEMLETPDRNEDGNLPPDSCGRWCKLNLCLCHDVVRCGPLGQPMPPPQPPKKKKR